MEQPAVVALVVAMLVGVGYLAIVCALLHATSGNHAPIIIVGLAGLLLAAVPTFAGGLVSFWHFAAFFSAELSLMVFVYGAVLKSLSLAMLVEISRTQAHQLSLDELADRVVRPAFEERARLLVDSGAALQDGPRYVITAKGLAIAQRIQDSRRFLRLESLGLYGS